MPQIVPINELKKTRTMSELCHNSQEPVYITKNGYGDMVIMSIELYESMVPKQGSQAFLKRADKPRKASVQAVSHDSDDSDDDLSADELKLELQRLQAPDNKELN